MPRANAFVKVKAVEGWDVVDLTTTATQSERLKFMTTSKFNFDGANEEQKEAILQTEGPVLITAGPGTGKTKTMVTRVLYLLEVKGVQPEEIFISTFTEKAAKELTTRLSNGIADHGLTVDVTKMWIGTFHSLCMRILKENLEYSPLRKNFRTLEDFDQKYMVWRHRKEFYEIEGFNLALPDPLDQWNTEWNRCGTICSYANVIAEELVDLEELMKSDDNRIAALGRICKKYNELLDKQQALDFSKILTETYRILSQEPNALQKIQDQIKYIMIDEYQDTNWIQEQIMLLLGGKQQNICVVGDDDQALYRFRGATVENILSFKSNFEKCKEVNLKTNYRSNSEIVKFYNEWMKSFEWGNYRLDKKLEAYKPSKLHSPAVIKIHGLRDENIWHNRICDFLKTAKQKGVITDYNQVAILLSSVSTDVGTGILKSLEAQGIPVYSPRSKMFFDRKEIKLLIGVLISLFPNFLNKIPEYRKNYPKDPLLIYYEECLTLLKDALSKQADKKLEHWISETASVHENLTEELDYAFAGLFYRILEFEPFKSYLERDLLQGNQDTRPLRNLAIFSQIIGSFEYTYNLSIFSGKKEKNQWGLNEYVEVFFITYLREQKNNGIGEYEDDAEYAPSGCVSMLTIHQAKGMEFPIVIVDSISTGPEDHWYPKDRLPLIALLRENGILHKSIEPTGATEYYDFRRRFFTAFSRAQNLLVLTAKYYVNEEFKDAYDKLTEYDNTNFNIEEFELDKMKAADLKPTFSFTSDINVYENCPRQYKFFKELQFAPHRVADTMFGTLVHQTIEDVHKAALRGEEDTITSKNIEGWFKANYSSLANEMHQHIGLPQRKAALNHVKRYVDRKNGDWSDIKQAEVDVSMVLPECILQGQVDLVRGEGDTVEIVDFKSMEKHKITDDPKKLESYRKQLIIYAHLVEQRYQQKVSKMHLYFTSEKEDPLVTFEYTKQTSDRMMAEVKYCTQQIKNKNFEHGASSKKVCTNCDFRHYCKELDSAQE